MKKDVVVFIQDILDFIEDIDHYVKSKTKSDFLKNKMLQDAIIRKVEIIGEATKNIPQAFKNKYPSLPWKNIAGMRDVLIHAYAGVKLDRVWTVVEEDLPELKKEMEKILEKEK